MINQLASIAFMLASALQPSSTTDLAYMGTLVPDGQYLVWENGFLARFLIQADEEGRMFLVMPPPGYQTQLEFMLYATATPTALPSPTGTPTNTPTATATPTATPFPTLPPEPTMPIWSELTPAEFWPALAEYSKAYNEWLSMKKQYERNGWLPTNKIPK